MGDSSVQGSWLEIVDGGVSTTVQDLGRPGYYAMGLPPSGAMDRASFAMANALVGNEPGAAVLEATFNGPVVCFRSPTFFAVAGADVHLDLDGVPIPAHTCLAASAGQTLSVGVARRGVRSYLAVRGGIEVPVVMGSRSTYLSSAIGGHHGRAVTHGDRLAIGTDTAGAARVGRSVPSRLLPHLGHDAVVRVVPGLCDYRLSETGLAVLYGERFEVSVEANRMGIRFTGPPLEFVPRIPPFGAGDDPSNVVNLGYPLGSIQAPSGVELICLMRDAVTGGGYATVGTVIGADLDRLAQLAAPDTVTFVPVSMETGLAERAHLAARIEQIRALA